MKGLFAQLVFKAMQVALDLKDPTELAVAEGPTLGNVMRSRFKFTFGASSKNSHRIVGMIDCTYD